MVAAHGVREYSAEQMEAQGGREGGSTGLLP